MAEKTVERLRIPEGGTVGMGVLTVRNSFLAASRESYSLKGMLFGDAVMREETQGR
jgi:hypothetical protein